ncbi:tetratricopeptide repeat protein [Persicimonas caeni]|uniref:tetratricopeptide repeat protein n=1 Tax=Persicimonas caeni TaxID=2292766 RepID=UPI00143CEA15|nr:tetratricopeptide repeat protein [Persicimonas caeni]
MGLASPAAAQDSGGEPAQPVEQTEEAQTAEASDAEASQSEASSSDASEQEASEQEASNGEASDGEEDAEASNSESAEAEGGLAQAEKDFQEAYRRYSEEMSDYQGTVDSIVEAEYNQRIAKINRVYDRKIDNLEAVERQRRKEAIAAFEEYLRRYPDTPGYTPDALFRLAELYFEKANDDYLVADENYQSELALYEAGKRADPPKLPERDYSKTMSLFTQLITDWPDYEQADGAYYLLAYTKLQDAQDDEARQLLTELVQNYPDSRFVPEAWIRIGEYWFAYAEGPEALAKAKNAYEQAMQYPDSKFYDKALYKLAWTYYRMDDFKKAIGEFKRLVKFSDEQKQKTGRSGSVLRAEAVQYIAVSLAEEDWDLDGAVDMGFGLDRVKKYLSGDEPYEREVLVQFVDYMFENNRYAVAAETINYALSKYPRHRDNPQLHEKLILALIRDGRRDASFAERRNLLAYYGPESDWYEFQERVGHEDAVRHADNLVKDNLIQSATWFHEEAQKLKNEAVVRQDTQMLALAREKYAKAASAYEDFLARYPNDKDLYQWNFYYAECLYYSEQYVPAYEQYRVVRELDISDNKYQEKAAFNAIKSIEFKMRELAQRGEIPAKAVPGGGVEDARQAAQQQESASASAQQAGEGNDQKRVIEPEAMPAMLGKYITAMDRYVVLGLENESDPDLDLKFAFQAGKLFYDFKDYDTARERFNWIVDNYPENELAYLAGSLILETYRQEQDYTKLAAAAERLSEVIKGEQAQAIKEEVRQFKLGAMFKSAEQLFANKQYEKAAKEYQRVVNNAPDHEYAPKALNNAAVAYENIGKYESAMKLYERVYNDYPQNPLAGYALYRVAVNSERFFDFDKAVQSYTLFYDKYEGQNPQELTDMGFIIADKRQNALRSASVLTENLQRYERAAKLYEQYVRAYPSAEDSAGAQWRALKSWQKAGEPRKMMKAISTYRREFGGSADKNAKVLEAMMMVAEHYEDSGDERKATKWYEDIVEEFKKRSPEGDPASAYYAANARFLLAEESFQDWKAIEIKGSMKRQGRLLKKKIEVQKEVAKEFQEVWSYGSLEWTLASTFRIGSLYQAFAESLYNVPIPFEEGTEEFDIYRMQLDDMVIPLEDKAIQYYEQTIAKAREEKVVNEWTKKTLEELNKFMPDKYPLYKEERREVAKRARTGTSFMSADAYEASTTEPSGSALDEGSDSSGANGAAGEQGDDS